MDFYRVNDFAKISLVRIATTYIRSQASGFHELRRLPVSNALWLSVPEVARILGLSPVRVGQMCREALVPAIRHGGKWIVPVAAFDRWNEERATAALERVRAHERERVGTGG